MARGLGPLTPTARWRRATALALVASLVFVGACSSGDDDATNTAADAPEEGGEATTATEAVPPAAVATDLVGTWTMDASGLFPPGPATPGMSEQECEGTVTLEFRDDGSFSQRGDATCMDPLTDLGSSITIDTTGSFETSGSTIRVTAAESAGTISLGGAAQPADFGLSEGEATYEVAGETLTIGFSSPRLGQVTHVYQRA